MPTIPHWDLGSRTRREYAVAGGVTLTACALAAALALASGDEEAPALVFLAAVGVAGWYGGIRAALVPTIAGGLALDYFFETPRFVLAVTSARTVVGLASYVLVAVLVGLLNHRLREANARLRAERDRAEAAVRARDELMATVSHALRTPLTTIQMAIFTLRDQEARVNLARRQSLLANVADEADRLVRFVTDALALSRLENTPPTHFEWNDVNEVVWAVLDRCTPMLGDRQVTLDIPDNLPLARLDAGLLDQALVALLENVASHTPPGTPVWIEADAQASDLRLAISDAGPGIPDADRERIFGKYERVESSTPGVGLGLAIARAAVQAQGGRLWAEANERGGARFVMLLPDVLSMGMAHAS